MPQRASAQPNASRERRSRSNAPTEPASRIAPAFAPEHTPEVEGVFELQRTVGNRAVAAAAASGDLSHMIGHRRASPAVQRAPARTAFGDSNDKAQADASAVVQGIRGALQQSTAKMQHLPAEQADMWIGILQVYTSVHPDWAEISYLFVEPENLYELLAPFGFHGKGVRYEEETGTFVVERDVEDLLAAIKTWKGEDAKTRKRRRASAHSTRGTYDRDVDVEEVAYEDQQIVAGPNRADPSEPWGPDYEGTRAARRSERERLKNEHAMGMIEGIASQGPGGFVGMVAGGVVGLLPGVDSQKSTEVGMAVGGLADPFLMTGAALAPGEGGGDDPNRDEMGEMHERKGDGAKESEQGGRGAGPTMRGTGVTGPSAAGKPAGGGAYKTLKTGPVASVRVNEVIEQHKGDANLVRHSASDSWHQFLWVESLKETGQWDFEKGPAPEAPLAFRMKGGMIQVNDLQWVKQGRSIKEIIRPSQVASGGKGGGGTSGAGSGGTQVGHAEGPGGTGGASPKGSQTQKGYAPGPGGDMHPPGSLKGPNTPPRNPPGDTVKPATFEEVKKLFEQDPSLVTVGGDSLEFHQYIWEYRRWWDGRPTKEQAPAAFWVRKDAIRISPGLWRELGHDPMELIAAQSPGRQPTEFESAKTMPGGAGGAGSTMGGSIAPGVGRKP